MNKQRKVVITTTYNEMGIIIDTKAEELDASVQPNVADINVGNTISRQAAIDIVLEYAKGLYKHVGTPEDNEMYSFGRGLLLSIERNLKGLPSAQPERKKGKWSFIGDNMFECTCCGTPYTTQQLNGLRNYNTDPYAPKFCPNCGADMRGEQE